MAPPIPGAAAFNKDLIRYLSPQCRASTRALLRKNSKIPLFLVPSVVRVANDGYIRLRNYFADAMRQAHIHAKHFSRSVPHAYGLSFFKKGSCQLLAKVCARSTG